MKIKELIWFISMLVVLAIGYIPSVQQELLSNLVYGQFIKRRSDHSLEPQPHL